MSVSVTQLGKNKSCINKKVPTIVYINNVDVMNVLFQEYSLKYVLL